jgi:threonine synthase
MLVPVYDLAEKRRETRRCALGQAGSGIRRFRNLLPSCDGGFVTLGEGDTPLLSCHRLGERYGLRWLFLKQESVNPTGAFKDRESCIVVSVARHFGVDTVSCASTGSMAASLAAYAARAGLVSWILVPVETPREKLIGAAVVGGRMVLVEGSYERAAYLQTQGSEEFGWYNCTSAVNPYRVEGDKTSTYEIWLQLGRKVPDWVLVPKGSGGNLCGQWRAWVELRDLGLVDTLPRMASIGVAAGAPLAAAFACGLRETPVVRARATVAGGLLSSSLDYGSLALDAVYDSEGIAVAVTDDELLDAQRLLARTEGVFAEPSGAAGIAAIAHMVDEGLMCPDDTVVVVMTGGGFRDAGVVQVTQPPRIGDSLDDLRSCVTGSGAQVRRLATGERCCRGARSERVKERNTLPPWEANL